MSQIRDGNLDEFFEHEIRHAHHHYHIWGKLRTGTKSDLLGCLEDLVSSQENSSSQGYKLTL